MACLSRPGALVRSTPSSGLLMKLSISANPKALPMPGASVAMTEVWKASNAFLMIGVHVRHDGFTDGDHAVIVQLEQSNAWPSGDWRGSGSSRERGQRDEPKTRSGVGQVRQGFTHSWTFAVIKLSSCDEPAHCPRSRWTTVLVMHDR